MIFIGNMSIEKFKSVMKKEFEMTNLGLIRYILGIEVDQSEKIQFSFVKQSMPRTC